MSADAWESLYRRAINVANGLTNYVDERPELRRAERAIEAIECDARALSEVPEPIPVGEAQDSDFGAFEEASK